MGRELFAEHLASVAGSDEGSWRFALGREGVDTFVLDVLAIEADGVEPPSLGSLCSLCGRDPRVRCELLARECRCGAALVDPRAIDEAFTGLRFEDLPDDRTLCARMVLANRGVGGGEPTACADLPTCDVNVDDVELCGLTEAFALGRSEPPITFSQYVCRETVVPTLDAGLEVGCDLLDERCRRGMARRVRALRDTLRRRRGRRRDALDHPERVRELSLSARAIFERPAKAIVDATLNDARAGDAAREGPPREPRCACPAEGRRAT
ncbi:MAG: hypothetical protein H6721_04375 [Sandaracinus sp.]|nr:hypothetical protein [Sandaracinus sp.]